MNVWDGSGGHSSNDEGMEARYPAYPTADHESDLARAAAPRALPIDTGSSPPPMRFFWIGIGTLVSIGVIGISGQAVGLRAIDEFSTAKLRLESIQQETDELQTSIPQLRADTAAQRSELQRLTAQVTEQLRLSSLAKQSADEAGIALNNSISARREAESIRDAAVAQTEEAEAELASLQDDRSRLTQDIASLEQRAEQFGATVSRLELQLSDLVERRQEVLEELSGEQAILADIQDASRKAREARTAVESDIEMIRGQLSDARNELESVVAQSTEARQLAQRKNTLEATVATLTSRRDFLNTSVTDLEEEVSSLREESAGYIAQRARIEADLAASERQVTAANAEAARLAGQRDAIANEVTALTTRVSELRQNRDSLQRQIDTLEGVFGDRQAISREIDTLRTQRNELNTVRTNVVAELATMEEQLAEKQRDHANLSAEIKTLRAQSESLRIQEAELRARIARGLDVTRFEEMIRRGEDLLRRLAAPVSDTTDENKPQTEPQSP